MSEDTMQPLILDMLASAPNLTPLQRVIVTTDGTVQSTLSAVFKKEVIAKVISQRTVDNVVVRWAQLIIKDTDQVVCLAESVIPRKGNFPSFMEDIDARELGIGQILKKNKVITKRIIVGIFCNEDFFTRTYRIEGSATDILITEVFPTRLYGDVL